MDQNKIQDEFVCHVVSLTARKNQKLSRGSDEINDITNIFRWLRNNSPHISERTKQKVLESNLIETCLWFCDNYFTNESLSRSVILQFLANFSVNFESVQQYIIEHFQNTLRNVILSSDDSKLLNNSIMLVYNLCLYDINFRVGVLKDNNIIQKIMFHWTENELEYGKIFLDSIFSNSTDFLLVYANLPDSSKHQLIDILLIWLDHYSDDVSLEVINVLKDNLVINCTIEEISSHVVNALAKASTVDKFRFEIQKHSTFLKKLMDLLIVTHEQGKKSDDSRNEFKRVKDVSALFVNSDVLSSNRFWFKSDIIQLIANMCHNHEEHQNLMRTKNIIPILLECCSFDAKNPLMREWSLFALRNILEGNLDNQNFVANINSVGSTNCEPSVMLTDTLGMASLSNDTMYI